jgi:gluconate kinase
LLSGREQAEMAFLVISRADDEARLEARTGHFFTEPLLASQYADLEMPGPDEPVHKITVGHRPPGQVATEIIKVLGLVPADGQSGRGPR